MIKDFKDIVKSGSNGNYNILGIETDKLKEDIVIAPIFLTPELAKRVMELNISNRSLTRAHLVFISESIKDKKFVLTGETVIISDQCILINGQHRLQAIIESDIGAPIVLVVGIKHEHRHYMDLAKARVNRCTFQSEGIENYQHVYSVVMLLYRYHSPKYSNLSTRKILPTDLLEFYYSIEHEITKAFRDMRMVKPKGMNYVLPQSYYAFMRYETYKINPEMSSMFMKYCLDPHNYPSTTAHKAFSIIFKIKKNIIVSKNANHHCLELMCLAWNDFRNDKDINAYDLDTTKRRRLPELI